MPIRWSSIRPSACWARRRTTRTSFSANIDWLVDYLKNKPAPKYPFPIDQPPARAGQNSCSMPIARAAMPSERTGTRIPIAEIGTDPERIGTWNKQAAIEANKVVKDMGIERTRPGRGAADRLCRPVSRRHLAARALSAQRLGAHAARSAQSACAAHQGLLARLRRVRPGQCRLRHRRRRSRAGRYRIDISQRGNGNQGHEFGVDLASQQKQDLLEYLKTL